jgi:miniconductance mechanosensitive channel
LLVRQLSSGPQGVPIEIYCFSNDTDWVAYEAIQSDLFDRILAIVPEFGLRVFQEPSGADLAGLGGSEGIRSAN